MSLTSRQQFKFGFLLRCADEGLTEEQTQVRIKEAHDRLTKEANPKALWDAVKSLGWHGLGMGAVTGLGAGYGAAKLTEKEVDPDDIKKQELIAAYKQNADRVRRNMMARSYRGDSDAPQSPSLSL